MNCPPNNLIRKAISELIEDGYVQVDTSDTFQKDDLLKLHDGLWAVLDANFSKSIKQPTINEFTVLRK